MRVYVLPGDKAHSALKGRVAWGRGGVAWGQEVGEDPCFVPTVPISLLADPHVVTRPELIALPRTTAQAPPRRGRPRRRR